MTKKKKDEKLKEIEPPIPIDRTRKIKIDASDKTGQIHFTVVPDQRGAEILIKTRAAKVRLVIEGTDIEVCNFLGALAQGIYSAHVKVKERAEANATGIIGIDGNPMPPSGEVG